MVCILYEVKPRGVIVQETDKNSYTNDKSKGGLPSRICSSKAFDFQTVAPSKIEKNKTKKQQQIALGPRRSFM